MKAIDLFYTKMPQLLMLTMAIVFFTGTCNHFITFSKLFIFSDTAAYYTAGKIAAENPQHLYDLQTQLEVQKSLKPIYNTMPMHEVRAFLYPPHVALPFMAMIHLPPDEAGDLYLSFSILTFLAVFVVCIWQMRIPLPAASLILLCFGFFEPWKFHLLNGQVSPFLTAGVALFFLAIMRQNYALLAGALLLFTIKPHLFLLMLIPLWFEFRWRGMLLAAILAALLMAISSLWFGLHVWSDYIAMLGEISASARDFGSYAEGMYNLSGILLNLTEYTTAQSKHISLVLLALCLPVGALLYRSVMHGPVASRLILTGFLLMISLFLSPWTHLQSMLSLCVPAMYVYSILPSSLRLTMGVCLFAQCVLTSARCMLFVDSLLFLLILAIFMLPALRYQAAASEDTPS